MTDEKRKKLETRTKAGPSNTYSKIRFIGYAIPTTPAGLISIGDPNGPGAVAGSYLANSDFATDISKRIAIMENAVLVAKQRLPVGETDVINVFMAPEFYFHGQEGPYIYSDPSQDPVDVLKQQLAEKFNASDYPNWMFICGSAITTLLKNVKQVYNSNSVKTRNNVVKSLSKQWLASFGPLKGVIFDMLVNFIKNCHSYPNCEVRNRSVIVSNIPIRTPQVDNPTNLMTTEKYFVSNEDFLLYEVTGKPVITEQMTAYPPIDLSSGDAKQSAFDQYAIFRQDNIDPNNPIATTVTDYGVEICLDHSDVRLRRNIDNEPRVIGGIHVQLIPSCGMQISLPSVATDSNGLVFNCDGQYPLMNGIASGQDVINGVNCLFANYCFTKKVKSKKDKKGKKNKPIKYGAHSQLARVLVPASGGDPNAKGSSNATFATLDAGNISVVPVDKAAAKRLDLKSYFAGGAGEVHIYGLNDPFTLYP